MRRWYWLVGWLGGVVVGTMWQAGWGQVPAIACWPSCGWVQIEQLQPPSAINSSAQSPNFRAKKASQKLLEAERQKIPRKRFAPEEASGFEPVDPSQCTQFLRIRRDEKNQPVALETAIVRYVPRDCTQTSPTVDLVAAVHIAERSYYRQLNRQFQQYEVVLYELVAPEGTRIPKGGARPSGHPVSLAQRALSEVLQLTHQLEEIDYTPQHFVHADMSPEQLSKAMKARGETIWKMMLRAMGYSLAKQAGTEGPPPEVELLLALFDKNRAVALKRAMAREFEDMEGMTQAMEGPEGSSLIAGRNQAALAVLRDQLAKGKKKVAIFYGAAHMPDMEKRLKEEFGLVPIQVRWLVAWDLQGPSTAEKPFRRTRQAPTSR